MSRIRIFVSYDAGHDVDLYDLLQAESAKQGASFECAARSTSGMLTDSWSSSSRSRIRAADEVVVICGQYTDASEGVAAEFRIAQEEDKPYMLLWGRREQMCTKPSSARSSDAMYSWTREILASQLTATIRNAEPVKVPERCKRSSG